ncbi:EamA family transporter [bacterium]|nr:EamA family transporter [bacterium]
MLMALAVLVFAMMDVTTKHMTLIYAVPLVVFMRYAANLVLIVALFGPGQGRRLVAVQRPGLVLVRGACLATSSLCAALALHLMPMAETVAIIFLAPFGVMLLSGPILRERVGLPQWIAALAGLVGVLLIVRPGSGLDPVGVVCALTSAAASIVYNMLSRSLARSETTQAMLFWTALVGTLAFGAALPWCWPSVTPSLTDLGLFGAMGGFATLGHYLFTQANRAAPAAITAPVNYLQLVWESLLGWLVFAHLPDGLALLGMGLIATGGVFAALWPVLAQRLSVRFAAKAGNLVEAA